MKRILLSLVLTALFLVNAKAQPVSFQSTADQSALLELYTSEGCSSCPPAEAWLSRLKDSPGLWKDFVPVSFHVDYWDHLGWRDPWAKPAFSDRQRTYAEAWHSESIYTPEFVLNGKEWLAWRAESGGPKLSGIKGGVLTITSSDTNHWRVSFAPANPALSNCEVHAAMLAGGLSSDVKAGENRGRQLSHDFAVTSLIDAPMTHDALGWNAEIALPFRPDASGNRPALAVWVTQSGHLEPLQAAGGWLLPTGTRH